MSSEKKEELDPKLERQLTDDNGRIICSCRGSMAEIVSCFSGNTRLALVKKGDVPDDKRLGALLDAALKAKKAQLNCAFQGIDEIAEGFIDEEKGKE